MLAVLFGVLAGAFFGALAVTVADRAAKRRGARGRCRGRRRDRVRRLRPCSRSPPGRASGPAQLWAFVLVGMLVPGVSQILFVLSVRDAGPSRAAILIGTAPLISVLIALTLLDEPFHVALVAGTVLVVAGGAALTRERVRPHDFRALGVVLALICAALFAVRDNVVRWVARDQHPPPLVAPRRRCSAPPSLARSLYLRRRQAAAALAGRLRAAARAVRARGSRARGRLRVPARGVLARPRQRSSRR